MLQARWGSTGHGSNQQVLAPGATDGGDALVQTVLSNDRGGVVVVANASGGADGPGQSGGRSGRGGNATLSVTATSSGAGYDVTVAGDIFQFFGARGGISRATRPRRGTIGIPASGGNADSRSVGIALGDSLVTVRDIARGGEGFDGGHASSYARGENQGSMAVAGSSEARGGRTTGGVGKAGDAHAVAKSALPAFALARSLAPRWVRLHRWKPVSAALHARLWNKMRVYPHT